MNAIFLSLLLCLSLGTASLPHILTRYNTTTSVASARRSVGWTLFFVALFYRDGAGARGADQVRDA